MGFRSTWIAVPREHAESALKQTGMREGERIDMMEVGLYGLSIHDWYVVIGSGWDYMGQLTAQQARALSTEGRALFWFADDTSMGSHMSEYRDGQCSWSFNYGEGVPRVEGAVPEVLLQTLRAQQDAQQADPGCDHVYEVAHLAGETLVGFRHDTLDLPEGTELRVLRPASEADPTRSTVRHGPFDVELVMDASGSTVVKVKALKKVHVTSASVMEAGESQQHVVEFGPFSLDSGSEREFVLGGPESRLLLVVRGLFGKKSFELRGLKPGVA